MNNNFHAVIMGFNKFQDYEQLQELQFAEKDALDLYAALIDPDIGNYPKENIVALTGNIPEDEIETQLFTHIVKDRTPEETVLVYYSGHGFIAGENQKAFLGTPDVSIMNILNNPKAGLQMEYLHNEIFMETKAQYVILLLDCCHSGAFCPTFKGDNGNDGRELVEGRFFSGEGRVAFVSSPRGIKSRESKQFQHGIFTYHLLNGLKGEAIERYSGEVTINSLIAYVQAMSPSSQPPLHYGKSTRIVLTRPKSDLTLLDRNQPYDPAFKVYDGLHFASLNADQKAKATPLVNPIEGEIQYVDKVLAALRANGEDSDHTVGERILSSIRQSLDADFVFLQRIEADRNIVLKLQSDFPYNDVGLEDYKQSVLAEVYQSLIRPKEKLLPARFGFYKPVEAAKDSRKHVVAVPLRMDYPREYLILCGIDDSQLTFGEIIGHTLISIFNATGELTSLELPKIECTILDDLKRDFLHVPNYIYERQHTAFLERLSKISFWFEPIVRLGKRTAEIDSWEALARDLETKAAPFDLFNSAELWGPEFILDLDMYCLRNALLTYQAAWQNERMGQRIDPISVNVYPETLIRPEYQKELRKILHTEELINGEKLVLELSEKRPLPTTDRLGDGMLSDWNSEDAFIELLHEYSKEFNIGFAIDDFGIKHSSVARLAKFELDHVKIDRDVLHHPHPESTYRYVLEIVGKSHPHKIKVVAEGFDGDSKLSLSNLHNTLGIGYIQGHLVRRASPNVCDLSPEESNYLLRLIAS